MQIPFQSVCFVIGCAVATVVAAADVRPTDPGALRALVAHHAPSLALLERKTIRVAGRGTVEADFHAAMLVLTGSNLLDRVQEEYARSLPDGQEPEFVLQPADSNRWTYVNRHGQHSEVCEVARVPVATDALAAVFYAKGERFFGLFESLTVIHATPAPEGGIRYDVAVFAYPHQPVCRFVIRHLGLVERYFRNKTKELETVAARITGRLCGRAGEAGEDERWIEESSSSKSVGRGS